MDKQHKDDKPDAADLPRDEERRKLMVRGGLAAGGMAAFAAGYGETVTRAVKGLAQGTAGVPTAHAVPGSAASSALMMYSVDPT